MTVSVIDNNNNNAASSSVGAPKDLSTGSPSTTNTTTDTQETSTARRGVRSYVTNLVTLTQPETTDVPPPADKQFQGAANELFDYLTKTMLMQIAISKNQSQLSGASTELSTIMSNLLDKTAKNAADSLAALVEKRKEQDSESWWQKAIGYVGAGLLMVVGALTGQVELIGMGLLALVMEASGGQNALNNALEKLGPVGKIFAELGVAIGEAILTCGASAIASGAEAAEEITETVVKDVVTDVVTDAAEDVAEDVVTDVVNLGENLIGDAAEQAIKKASQKAVKEFESLAATGCKDAKEASKIAKALGKIGRYLKGGKVLEKDGWIFKAGTVMRGGNFVSHLTKTLVMGQFWQDIVTQIAMKCTSEETAKNIGMIVGMAVGFTTAFAANGLENPGECKALVGVFKNLAGTTKNLDRFTDLTKFLTFSSMVTVGGLGVAQGFLSLDQHDIMETQAKQKHNMVILQHLVDGYSDIFSKLQDGYNAVQQEYANLWQGIDKYLAPYNPALIA